MTNTLRTRVISGMGANAFGIIIAVVIQLASLPIYLHYWGVSKYGVWIILSAIPTYLSLADMGIIPTAGNKMTIALGNNNTKEANRVFQSAFLFIIITCISIFIILIPIILYIPINDIKNTFDYRVALGVLCFGVLISINMGLVEAVFRSTGRYAQGTFFINLSRLVEWGGSIIGIVIFDSFSAVAIGAILVRLISLFLLSKIAMSGIKGVHYGFKESSISELKIMVKPALSFTLMPLASSLSLQGVIILIGQMLGTTAVAQFSTYRTLARVTVQFNSTLSWALWPEFSRIYGVGGVTAVKVIFKKSSRYGLIMAILTSILLYVGSPYLIKFWTNGEIKFDPFLMLTLCVYSAFGGAVHIPKAFLLSINKHNKLAILSVINSIFLIVLSMVIGKIFGIYGFGISILISEIISLLICLNLIYSLLNRHN